MVSQVVLTDSTPDWITSHCCCIVCLNDLIVGLEDNQVRWTAVYWTDQHMWQSEGKIV